jgi:hypothetical protein
MSDRITKKNLFDIRIVHVLINQQPLVFTKATSFQIHQISVLHARDQDNFVREFIKTSCCLHMKLLHGHHVSICKHTLHFNALLNELQMVAQDSRPVNMCSTKLAVL